MLHREGRQLPRSGGFAYLHVDSGRLLMEMDGWRLVEINQDMISTVIAPPGNTYNWNITRMWSVD